MVDILIILKKSFYWNLNTYTVDSMSSIPIEDRTALVPSLVEETEHHPYSEAPLLTPPYLCFPKVTLA